MCTHAAQLRIVADGGANQLYDSLMQWPTKNGARAALTDYVPDIIEGDMDSIRPDVRDFYSRLGTRQGLTQPCFRILCSWCCPEWCAVLRQDHRPLGGPGQHRPAEVPGVRLQRDRGGSGQAAWGQHLCSRRALLLLPCPATRWPIRRARMPCMQHIPHVMRSSWMPVH
jgi:hypothetical protein